MRYSLVEHVRPELAECIEGTTDSEWIYALVLSQLEDPWARPEARELADATAASLRILRKVREAHAIDTSSPVNLCLSTGRALVATRFSFDYGWYPPEDEYLEVDLPFVSLWYAIGGEYVENGAGWEMTAADVPRSLLIASEPLTSDQLVVARGARVLDADRRGRSRRCTRVRGAATSMSEADTVSFLAGTPLLAGGDEADLAELAGAMRRRRAAAGDVLWSEGDEARGAALRSGR